MISFTICSKRWFTFHQPDWKVLVCRVIIVCATQINLVFISNAKSVALKFWPYIFSSYITKILLCAIFRWHYNWWSIFDLTDNIVCKISIKTFILIFRIWLLHSNKNIYICLVPCNNIFWRVITLGTNRLSLVILKLLKPIYQKV